MLVANAGHDAKGLVLGAACIDGPAEGDIDQVARQLPMNVMLDAAVVHVHKILLQRIGSVHRVRQGAVGDVVLPRTCQAQYWVT